MSDVHNFRTADGCLVQTSPAPDYLGPGHILTLSMTGKHDARRVSVHLRPDEIGQISDGYHTFNELYRYRMLYHAAYVSTRHRIEVDWLNYRKSIDSDFEPVPTTVKSWRHSDGEECFGGGWFIVVTQLPTGQISNHYEADHWTLFEVPEVENAPEWDGHTPAQAAARLEAMLRHG